MWVCGCVWVCGCACECVCVCGWVCVCGCVCVCVGVWKTARYFHCQYTVHCHNQCAFKCLMHSYKNMNILKRSSTGLDKIKCNCTVVAVLWCKHSHQVDLLPRQELTKKKKILWLETHPTIIWYPLPLVHHTYMRMKHHHHSSVICNSALMQEHTHTHTHTSVLY